METKHEKTKLPFPETSKIYIKVAYENHYGTSHILKSNFFLFPILYPIY